MQIQDTPIVTRDSDKFQLRLPEGMRQEIAYQAMKNGRSINAEMVARLRTSFDAENIEKMPLVKRQNEIISFLCECIEQLASTNSSDAGAKVKHDTVFALYRSMLSVSKVELK